MLAKPCFNVSCSKTFFILIEAEFGEGDATKQKSVKKSAFSLNARHSVNDGFCKEFFRKGNSLKRSGRFHELLDSEN